MRPWRIRSCVHGGSGLSDKPLFFKSTGIGSHLNCQSIYRAHEFKSEIELDFNLNWLQHKFCVSEIVWVPHSGWNPLTSPLSITVLQASYWESNFWSSSSNWRLDLKRLRAEPRTERDVCKHQKKLYIQIVIHAFEHKCINFSHVATIVLCAVYIYRWNRDWGCHFCSRSLFE